MNIGLPIVAKDPTAQFELHKLAELKIGNFDLSFTNSALMMGSTNSPLRVRDKSSAKAKVEKARGAARQASAVKASDFGLDFKAMRSSIKDEVLERAASCER